MRTTTNVSGVSLRLSGQGMGPTAVSCVRVRLSLSRPVSLADPLAQLAERIGTEIADDYRIILCHVAFPDDQPIVVAVPHRNPHRPSPKDRRRAAALDGSDSSRSTAASIASSSAPAPAFSSCSEDRLEGAQQAHRPRRCGHHHEAVRADRSGGRPPGRQHLGRIDPRRGAHLRRGHRRCRPCRPGPSGQRGRREPGEAA
jgi:hypothetical protein